MKKKRIKKIHQPKYYKNLSKVYKTSGFSLLGITTIGGFVAYESYINWENFKSAIDNFIVFNEETWSLNLTIAFPILIGLIVYLVIMRKKNKEFFKDKMSLGLLITIGIVYAFYSIAEALLFSLAGAFSGMMAYEMVFEPLSNKMIKKYNRQEDIDVEKDKELVRISARRQAKQDEEERINRLKESANGSV